MIRSCRRRDSENPSRRTHGIEHLRQVCRIWGRPAPAWREIRGIQCCGHVPRPGRRALVHRPVRHPLQPHQRLEVGRWIDSDGVRQQGHTAPRLGTGDVAAVDHLEIAGMGTRRGTRRYYQRNRSALKRGQYRLRIAGDADDPCGVRKSRVRHVRQRGVEKRQLPSGRLVTLDRGQRDGAARPGSDGNGILGDDDRVGGVRTAQHSRTACVGAYGDIQIARMSTHRQSVGEWHLDRILAGTVIGNISSAGERSAGIDDLDVIRSRGCRSSNGGTENDDVGQVEQGKSRGDRPLIDDDAQWIAVRRRPATAATSP